MTTSPTPLHRLEDGARRQFAGRFVGQIVAVTWSQLRSADDADVSYGELIGVADPLSGSSSSAGQLVIKQIDGRLVTIGLATVIEIRNPDETLLLAAIARHAQGA
jgi:hypothetical protein